jgi:hypothetical protein
MRIRNTALSMRLTLVEYKRSRPHLEKLINQPVCSEEREEEYERAKRRIFNEMMSPAPHYKYSISLGGTKVGGILQIFSRIYLQKKFKILIFVYLLEEICYLDYRQYLYIEHLLCIRARIRPDLST